MQDHQGVSTSWLIQSCLYPVQARHQATWLPRRACQDQEQGQIWDLDLWILEELHLCIPGPRETVQQRSARILELQEGLYLQLQSHAEQQQFDTEVQPKVLGTRRRSWIYP